MPTAPLNPSLANPQPITPRRQSTLQHALTATCR
jgi:hypothetical protein